MTKRIVGLLIALVAVLSAGDAVADKRVLEELKVPITRCAGGSCVTKDSVTIAAGGNDTVFVDLSKLAPDGLGLAVADAGGVVSFPLYRIVVLRHIGGTADSVLCSFTPTYGAPPVAASPGTPNGVTVTGTTAANLATGRSGALIAAVTTLNKAAAATLRAVPIQVTYNTVATPSAEFLGLKYARIIISGDSASPVQYSLRVIGWRAVAFGL